MKQFREEFSHLSRRGLVQILILIVGIIASITFASNAVATTYTTREQIPEQHQSDVAFLHGTDYDWVHVENGTREMTTLTHHYLYEDGSYTITNALGKNIANLVIFSAIIMLIVTAYRVVKLNDNFERYQFQMREERRRARCKNTSE